MALTPITWNVHATMSHTRANGPGIRFAVWVQGCSLGCSGCFNPETHASGDGARSTDDIFGALLASLPVDGVTVTGGEPLEQPAALTDFVRLIRSDPRTSGSSVIVLSGFTPDEIRSDVSRSAAVEFVDTVVAGRYNRGLHLGAGLRGSSNKTYWHLSDRHDDDDFMTVPEGEILIGTDGSITLTGMHEWAKVMGS